MTYEMTLEKIHSFYAFGKKPGLERITELMRILGDPQDSLSIIHVAGTNGKGSVCRYLYSVLEEAGYACGLYTSPYIETFTERIQFHGMQIPKKDLVRIGQKVFLAADEMQGRGFEQPTEFDIITAMAFIYFAEVKADYVVLEVGLGGRGDATNVVKQPLVTVITSISKDHMAILGDTLPKIAGEKAGICKPGVPMVFAVKDRESAEVIFQEAKLRQPAAPVWDVLGSCGPACVELSPEISKKLGGYCFTSEILGYRYDTIELGMAGMHQVENALCALTALELLRQRGQLKTPEEADAWMDVVRRGMRAASQPGRFELICRKPVVILDGAHNQDGVRSLAASLREHFSGKRILLILGILKDKAVGDVLEELRPLLNVMDITFWATEPDNPRKMGAEELACKVAETLGTDCRKMGRWETALAAAEHQAQQYDAVIFCGSLYLIGSIREGWRRDHEESTVSV